MVERAVARFHPVDTKNEYIYLQCVDFFREDDRMPEDATMVEGAGARFHQVEQCPESSVF